MLLRRLRLAAGQPGPAVGAVGLADRGQQTCQRSADRRQGNHRRSAPLLARPGSVPTVSAPHQGEEPDGRHHQANLAVEAPP